MQLKSVFFLIACMVFNYHAICQGGQMHYDCLNIEGRIPVLWSALREGDVQFSKRVVRIIDLRQKQNQVLMHPKNALPLILYNAIKEKKLVPFKNDSCTSVYTPEKVLSFGTDTQFVDNPDPKNPENTISDTVISAFDPLRQIYKLRIVEDWLYDKKHSSYIIRIISIAPVYKLKISGVDLGDQDLCVFRYFYNNPAKQNDVRNVLAKKCVFNRQNNAAMMSLDDFFEGRYFASYVVKISNQRDFYIKDQAEYRDKGLDAILENENIQDKLMKQEHDMYEN